MDVIQACEVLKLIEKNRVNVKHTTLGGSVLFIQIRRVNNAAV